LGRYSHYPRYIERRLVEQDVADRSLRMLEHSRHDVAHDLVQRRDRDTTNASVDPLPLDHKSRSSSQPGTSARRKKLRLLIVRLGENAHAEYSK
jgi:hypothetical protein